MIYLIIKTPPSLVISPVQSAFLTVLLELLQIPSYRILSTHKHARTHTHTPALFQDTATQVALSFLSVPPTSTCSLRDQQAAKVPKSRVTIQDALYPENKQHKRTSV